MIAAFGVGATELLIVGFCCFIFFGLLIGVVVAVVIATRGGRGQC